MNKLGGFITCQINSVLESSWHGGAFFHNFSVPLPGHRFGGDYI